MSNINREFEWLDWDIMLNVLRNLKDWQRCIVKHVKEFGITWYSILLNILRNSKDLTEM